MEEDCGTTTNSQERNEQARGEGATRTGKEEIAQAGTESPASRRDSQPTTTEQRSAVVQRVDSI